MVAAIEVYFDQPTERRFRVLWDALEALGVESLRDLGPGLHRPHMSLVCADRLDPALVAPVLDGLPGIPAMPLSFQYAGQFVGRVLYLGPVPTVELLTHQARVWQRLTAAGIPVWDNYAPGAWVPHATLALRVPRPLLTEAVRRCLEFLPIVGTTRGAAVADHTRAILHPLP